MDVVEERNVMIMRNMCNGINPSIWSSQLEQHANSSTVHATLYWIIAIYQCYISL